MYVQCIIHRRIETRGRVSDEDNNVIREQGELARVQIYTDDDDDDE